MHGYSKKDLLGKHLSIFHTPEQMPSVNEANRQLKETYEFKGEIWHARSDGTVFPSWMHNSILRDETDKPIGMIGTLTDITERKHAEKTQQLFWELINQSNDAIYVYEADEYMVAVARDLSERKRAEEEKRRLEIRIQQSQKMEALGTLASGIAHDFNNILTSILLNAEMISYHEKENSTIKSSAKEIHRNSLRAKALINQILLFTRATETKRVSIDMNTMLKDIITMLRPMTPSTVIIKQDISDEPEIIFADPTQIQQLIMNLCSNAVYAMRESGGILNVKLEKAVIGDDDRSFDGTPGSYVKLTVKDQGHGISAENMKRIFDPFFTTKPTGEGTGLGLSVVHGIVEENEGIITVESEKDKGTCFQLFLPTIEDKTRPVAEESSSIPTGHEKILFVDDEEAIVSIANMMFEHLGYKVTSTVNPADALETFRSKPEDFDLVLTDATMPEITGIDLSKKLLEIRPDIPIIICTGYSHLVSEEKIKGFGIKELIMKPFELQAMAKAIRKVLDHQ